MRTAVAWDAQIYPLLFAVAGALVAVALPRNPVGWLMLFIASCFALSSAALQLLATGNTAAAGGLAWWAERGSAVLVPATLLLVLLLPDGRLPSRGWRPAVSLVVALQLVVVAGGSLASGPVATDEPPPPGIAGLDNPLGLFPDGWSGAVDAVVGPVLILPFLLGVAAVVERLRRPAGDERPRVVTVLAGVLTFTVCATIPDLLGTTTTMWFHMVGVAALTAAILVTTVRGQFAPVRVAPLSGHGDATHARPHDQLDLQGIAPTVLSPREREVIVHVARGLTNSEIAAELTISPITVRNHVSSILTKLDAANRTQAVTRYLALRESPAPVDPPRVVNRHSGRPSRNR